MLFNRHIFAGRYSAPDNRGTRRPRRRRYTHLAQGLIATAMLLAVTMLLLPAHAAHASSSCTYPFCSETYNQSQYFVVVAHDWCGNNDVLYQDAPPCGYGDPTEYLFPGQHTDSHQDWDVLRIDKGWRYTVQVYSVIWGWSSVGSFDNRLGSTQEWVRVHNDQTMYVLHQST